MKFDFAIGNPPYQDNAIGENDTYAPPVYNKFLDAAYAVADSVEMIHPARFLFNAGSTPKAWNEKMLNDPHFKVMHYEEDASKVFANTDIKGGVAITYRTSDAKYEPIVVFTKYPALNHILHKVNNTIDFVPMDRIGELVAEKIVESRYSAKFTYNSDRDLKNPNSNNTGADLVGFIEMEDGAVNFLFGEVKTSEEHTNPPGVMYGSTGMIDQLVELGTNSDKLKSLVKWIFIKCNSDKDLLVQKYIREAMQHYVKDRSSIQLIGVLVRDTNPNEMDLKNRYIDLKKRINGQHNVQLLAVYSNYKMKDGAWEKLI